MSVENGEWIMYGLDESDRDPRLSGLVYGTADHIAAAYETAVNYVL